MRYDEILSRIQNLTKIQPNQSELCRITGQKQNTMSNRAKLNSTFPNDDIMKINEYYGIDLVKNKLVADLNEFIKVIYRPDVYLSAGYGIEIFNETNETMLIDKRLLITERGNKINPKNCEIVRISGNSMAPEYRHGDRVIIDKGDTEIMDGHIYAFRYNNACYVKEMNLLGDKVKCISLNKEYDPFYIESTDEFRVLGRIIPRVRL